MPWTQVFRTLGQGGACLFRRRAEAILGGTRTRPLRLIGSQLTQLKQPLSAQCSLCVNSRCYLLRARSPGLLSASAYGCGLCLCARGAFLPLRPLFRFLRFSAPLSGAEEFFLAWGTPWTRVFRRAGHPPAHQRFGRGDENYLVGEPVTNNFPFLDAVIFRQGCENESAGH